MYEWLIDNKIYLEYIGTVAMIIALLYTARSVRLAGRKFDTANNHFKVNSYRVMNLRYANLLKNIPQEMSEQKEYVALAEPTKLWVRRYFDLTYEEYCLENSGDTLPFFLPLTSC